MKFLFLFLGLLLPSLCSNATPPRPLIIGMELAYPPFEMTDPQGTPCGVSVDLAFAIGKALQTPVEIRNLPFDGLIPSLRTGKIDLILSSMTATPEREKVVSFSNPYLQTGLCLLINATLPPASFESPATLNSPNLTFAVKQGTTGHLYATKHLPRAKLLVLDRETACVLEVTQGKASAFIYDQFSILKHWQQNIEKTKAILSPIQNESWAIAVNKDNTTLKERINQFLSDFKAQGGFDALSNKWLPEQKAAFTTLGIPFVF